ncbi:hypothetical protein GCM10010841_28360 [Deinococcus aerophilus]|uniref:O-antigen ligase domain-containing protein n=1 Tax=Deinococcus aerophilus TaxID=522488 RepID=A0ABQ2GZH8_9DEIO|nr:hypothetical protein GCM10010841_28360 [Deinococcus aerophilus]
MGIINENTYATEQFKGVVVTLVVIAIALFFAAGHEIRRLQALKAIVLGNFIYCILKLFIIILIYLKLLSFDVLIGVFNFLNTTPVTLEILPRVLRIQTISDILSPFIVGILLYKRDIWVKYRAMILFILFASILFSYARAIWLLTFAVVILNPQQAILKKNYFIRATTAVSLFASLMILGPAQYLINRFYGENIAASDQIRSQQIAGLLEYSLARPFFGHGFGAYIPGIIRDSNAPYTYEVQWLALLMQVGILGLFVLLVYLMLGFVFMVKSRQSTYWIALYFMWLLMGFTNPYLTSSVAGIVFAICLYLSNEKWNNMGTERSLVKI